MVVVVGLERWEMRVEVEVEVKVEVGEC